MTIDEEKKIRNLINKGLKNKISLSETDLLAPNTKSWDVVKNEFKSIISNLISNLENDEYDDASGDISKAINMLKAWKKKIEKDINDSTIKENVFSDNEITATQIVMHVIDESFKKHLVNGSEKFIYGPDEEGTYRISAILEIPRYYFEDLEEATFETNKQLSGNFYQGPGQSFSQISVHAIKQNERNYILGLNIRGGYDI